MAKKRKASAPAAPQGPNLDVGKSKRRIKDYQDVADSDDEFHDARDRILLDEGPEAKRRKQWDDQEAFLQQSDEEVLGYSESESEDDVHDAPPSMNRSSAVNANDASEGSAASADSDEEAENVVGWGTSRSDLYGADAIETEEQALEEEAEALRLQKKQLQNMTAADYGFDEDGWQQGKQHIVDEEENKNIVTEVLPPLHITPEMTTQDRLKLLNSRYPEFAPLSQELIRMKKLHAALAGPTNSIAPHEANRLTKLRAATAYLGTLAMYFALLASTAQIDPDSATAMPANVLHEHAIMDSLVQCRTLWQKASRLPEDRETIPEDLSADEDGSEEDSASIVDAPTTVAPPLSRAQRHAKAAHAQAEVERLERLKRTELDLADLDALVAQASRNRAARPSTTAKGDDSDMGDEAPLTAREMAEKAKRKKSLRFYTSQIAQKANKRGASGRQAGGDEDIPHRERLRDRQARLNAEAEKRGRRDVGDDLGGDSDEDDARQAREIREEVDEDDYYDLVAARAARKKADKTALADAQQEAALRGGRVIEEETVGEDGKRKISYAIEKNKGLTPFRKKDVRNPRVKKRKKYDEKKKKLASMKPVYKGGEGRGGYGGELTGIKKGLVKSTRL